MKTCSKCHRALEDAAYGRQVYCQDCWRRYDAGRKRQKRADAKAARDAARENAYQELIYQIQASPPSLTNNQKRRLDVLHRICETCLGETCRERSRSLCPMYVRPAVPVLPFPEAPEDE